MAAVDEASGIIPFGTIASLFFAIPEDHVYAEMDTGSFAIHASTVWACNYIQIWNSATQKWESAQCSDYANSSVWGVGSTIDTVSGFVEPIVSQTKYATTYSYFYFNTEERKLQAVKAYERYTISLDGIDHVNFYASDAQGEIIYESNGQPLFRHTRTLSIILPEDV